MNKYAPKLSGYAAASKNEYLAESFVAYRKGELGKIDPEYKNTLDSIRKRNKTYVLRGQNEEVKASTVFTSGDGKTIIMTSKQFGKKAGKHASEFGLDISKEDDRNKLREIIQDIVSTNDVRECDEWRGQEGPVTCFVKHGDAVIVDRDNNFITVMKGGASNARVKNARRK